MTAAKQTPNPKLCDLIESTLRARGFDGLYNESFECACLIGALAPCYEPSSRCEAGYRVEGCSADCGEECTFHVVRERPAQ